MIRSSLITSLLLCGLVYGQTSKSSIYIPDNNATTGGANVIPFGQGKTSTTWRNQKYQTLIPASFANKIPRLIRDLGFAPSSTNLNNFDSIVIKMDVTTKTVLDQTFANNLTNAVTVLNAKDYTWHLQKDMWTRIGLQTNYLWIPTRGNLVIEIEVRGAGGLMSNTGGFRRSSTIERRYAVGWTTNPPASANASVSLAALKIELVTTDGDARPFGQGCAGSKITPVLSYTGVPRIGNTFSLNLNNALPSTVALHLMGAKSAAPIFPLDLTAFGAPGCKLFVSPTLVFTIPTLTGSNSLKIPVPNDSSLVGVRFWDQFMVLDKGANTLGFAASNFGRVLVGN